MRIGRPLTMAFEAAVRRRLLVSGARSGSSNYSSRIARYFLGVSIFSGCEGLSQSDVDKKSAPMPLDVSRAELSSAPADSVGSFCDSSYKLQFTPNKVRTRHLLIDNAGEYVELPPIQTPTGDLLFDLQETPVHRYIQCAIALVCDWPGNDGLGTSSNPADNKDCVWKKKSSLPQAHDYNLPMNCLSQAAAQKYCEWTGGRLPTVTEWLALFDSQTSSQRFPWGSNGPGLDWLAMDRAAMPYAFPGVELDMLDLGQDDSHQLDSPLGTQSVKSYSYATSPDGFFHLLGNVAEMAVARDGSSRAMGYGWRGANGSTQSGAPIAVLRHWDNSVDRHELLQDPIWRGGRLRSSQVGFRCVWNRSQSHLSWPYDYTDFRVHVP